MNNTGDCGCRPEETVPPIRKGDKFLCVKELKYYTIGKTYISEIDNCITDDEGYKDHLWDERPFDLLRWTDCFKKVEDKDFFQSIAEEYGTNFVQDASRPMPKGADCILSEDEVSYDTEYLIIKECNDIKNLLLEKNRKYGDSAITRGVLFDISPVVAIKARLNDKFARLKNDNKDEDEDIIKDILGYLILLRIAIAKEKNENKL